MNYITVADLIHPIGSVYFCKKINNDDSWDPNFLFGGTWIYDGSIEIDDVIFNTWHRTA